MTFRHSVPAIGMAISLSNCGPESMLNPTAVVPPQSVIPVGPETTFVNDLRGCRFDYRDKRGEYVYKLSKIGTYTFTGIARNKRATDDRQGLYIYSQTGKKTGRLIFDLKDTWNLTFVSPHRAIAKNEADGRSHTFEFEWQ